MRVSHPSRPALPRAARTSRPALALALATAGALTLAACGGGGGTGSDQSASGGSVAAPADSGTVKLIMQATGNKPEPFEKVVAAFEKEYPDIKVKAEFLPIGTTYADTLRTRLRGGNQPDVFYAAPGGGGLTSLLTLAEAGLTADLSGQAWTKDLVDANAKDLFYKGDRLTGVPYDRTVIAQFYNTKALIKTGIEVPRTMSELLTACRTARDKGTALIALAGANADNAGLLATSVAAQYVLADETDFNSLRLADKTTFADSKGWKATLKALTDMRDARCFQDGAEAADIPQAAPALAQGKALSLVIPSGVLNALRGVAPGLELQAQPLPGVTADATNIYSSQSDALAVSPAGAKNGAATTLLRYLTTEGGDAVHAKATGNLPLKGTLDEPALDSVRDLLADDRHVFPVIQLEWPNPEVYSSLGKGLQGLLTKQQTADDVLASMDEAWRRK